MQAACSTTATFCLVQVGDQAYACGKWKSSGDNTMYPKAFLDLQGWHIRHMAAGATHYAVAADQSTITWCVMTHLMLSNQIHAVTAEQSAITWCVVTHIHCARLSCLTLCCKDTANRERCPFTVGAVGAESVNCFQWVGTVKHWSYVQRDTALPAPPTLCYDCSLVCSKFVHPALNVMKMLGIPCNVSH